MKNISKLILRLPRDLRTAYRFTGGTTVLLLIASGALGLLTFVLEFTIGLGLQAVLVSLGLVEVTKLSIPKWVPSQNARQILIFFSACLLLRGFAAWSQAYLFYNLKETFAYLQRKRLYEWLFTSESLNSGRFLTLFYDYVDRSIVILIAIQNVLIQSILAVSGLVALFWISPAITAGIMTTTLVIGIPIMRFNVAIRNTGDQIAEVTEQVNRRLMKNVKNLLLMKTLGTERIEKQTSIAELQDIYGKKVSYGKIAGFMWAVSQFVTAIIVVVIALVAKLFALQTPGVMITYLYLLNRCLQQLVGLSNTVSEIALNVPAFRQYHHWWLMHSFDGPRGARLYPEENQDQAPPIHDPIGWKLSAVTFHYPNEKKAVLSRFDLEVAPGSMVVILGPSGKGKSTVLNLLLGQLKPVHGTVEVLIDGALVPLDKEHKTAILQNIGYVGPEGFLIEGTIRQNIAYGFKGQINPAVIDEVVRKAECQFIFDLPGALEHRINEQGLGLSTGQKQRICLARALLRKPRALILDELTGNLDPDTEEKLIVTMEKLKGETTILAATHRPAILRIADQEVHL